MIFYMAAYAYMLRQVSLHMQILCVVILLRCTICVSHFFRKTWHSFRINDYRTCI